MPTRHAQRRQLKDPLVTRLHAALDLPLLFLIFVLSCPSSATKAAETGAQPIRIGVLAFLGEADAMRRWSATADYLTASIEGYRFQVLPMDLAAMDLAVSRDELDFVLTNPGHYVELEARRGITRIVALKNQQAGLPVTRYGAVIFTRADRSDINSLQDLREHSFATGGAHAFGSFQMAWGELQRHGIDPFRDLRIIEIGFPLDNIVKKVLSGEADAGCVRTGVIESMAALGELRMEDIKTLNPIKDGFPFIHSTPLYPEWPFSKTRHTSEELAEKVALSLLELKPDSEAARAGHYVGWTIPPNYTAVHELLRSLQAPPYENFGEATLEDFIEKYWPWMLAVALGFVAGSSLLVYAYHLNRRLKRSSENLEEEIHEHERAKQKLLSTNARLQHLLTATPAMIYSCEPTSTCGTTFISDNVRPQLGHAPEEFLANRQFWIEHIHPEDKHQVQADVDILLRAGSHQREYRFRAKDGSYRWLHDEVRLVRDERGEPMEVVGYWIDITERIRALELARTHESELAHCLRLTTMGEMATALAHDLNQPLTAAYNYAQGCLLRLRSGQLDTQQLLHVLEEIVRQTERAAAVVRHVREFVGKEKSHRANHDIDKLISDAVRLILPEARRADITVHTELRASGAMVNINAIQVQQVVINIAHNALEAMGEMAGERHALLIESVADDRTVRVSLSDTGPGVPPESIEQIFNAFYTTKAGGMGMGLSISRTIIESHGGRLWAERASPHGMIFIFTLPLARHDV